MNRGVLFKNCHRLSQIVQNVRGNSNFLQITDEHVFRRVIMTNEKQRNSLGLDMIRSLQAAVDTINFDQCRVLVISSNNPKVFSAGHNLKELTTEKGAKLHEQVFGEFTDLCLSLRNLPVPVIAEVKGLAAAAGLQLAASCDLIIGSDKSSYSTPGVKFGVFCTTPGIAISRNISQKIAAKMLFTGEAINAHDALTHGLISEIVPTENSEFDFLEQRVNEICGLIASNSRFIVSLGKKAFYEQVEKPAIEDAYKIGCKTMLENLKFEDTQSGLKSFASKQKPVWSHSSNKVNQN